MSITLKNLYFAKSKSKIQYKYNKQTQKRGSRRCLVSFLRYSMSKNVVTLKSGSEVTQGH